MAEYIERETYRKRLGDLEGWCQDLRKPGLKQALEMFDEIPAADVSPVVRGKWVHITRYNDGERMIATCSRCRDRGEVRSIRTEFGIWEIDSPRCPNCGAKMDGVE